MMPTLQIIAKDVRRLRWALGLWTVFILLRTLLYALLSGVIGSAELHWLLTLVRWDVGDFALMALDAVVAYFFIAWAVYEDSPTVRDAFWVTRPQSGLRVFAAKVGLAFFIAVAIPVLAHVPWWLACGMPIDAMLGFARTLFYVHGTVAMVAICCASLTDGFPRYVLWTIMGFAVVFTLSLAIKWVLGKIGFESRGAVYPFFLLFAGFAVVALVPAALQYRNRNVPKSVGWLLFGATAYLVVMLVVPPDFRPSLPGAPPREGDSPLSIALWDKPRYREGSQRISLPVTADGVRPNEAVWGQVRARWTWKSGEEWGAASSGWLIRPSAVAKRMLAPDVAEPQSALPFRHSTFPARLIKRAQEEPPALALTGEIISVFGHEDGRMGVQVGANVRGISGSHRINSVQQRARVIDLECVSYESARMSWGYAYLEPTEYALVNPRDGTIAIDQNVGRTALTLGLVRVILQRITFQLPADPAWLDDAQLVITSFRNRRASRAELEIPSFEFEIAPPLELRKGDSRRIGERPAPGKTSP